MLLRRVARSESVALTKTHCGVPKGIRPFGPLSWCVLCRMTKNEHNLPAAHCAADEGEKAKFQATSPVDAHTVPAARVRCAVFVVHSLPRGKERTKKPRPGVPPGNPLALPLYKEKDERLHISL